MEYCPISLLFSLPAVASDSTLTNVASWATIFGLIGIFLAWKAYREQQNALKLQKQSLDKQIDDSNTADENTKKALAKQDEMIEQQKILGAWSLLAQKGTGDLGRKDALEFLHKQGKSLAGLDLSNAHLVGLKLNGANLTGCNFTGANLDDAEFMECKFDKSLRDARSDFHWNFNKCEFNCKDDTGNHWLFPEHFKHITFTECKFPSWHFKFASQASIQFKNCELTNAKFEYIDNDYGIRFDDCYIFISPFCETLPKAPTGYKFIFETNEDGTQRTEVVDGLKYYCITLTKNP